MNHQTRPPRTIPVVGQNGQPIVVDPDLPKPGPCCAPGTVRQLCDTCWPPLRDHAIRKGMPAYMVGQLRTRMYRMSPEEAALCKPTVVQVIGKGTIEREMADKLRAKASMSEAILKG